MFNMGFTEMLFIAGLALILIGPKQLPELARTLGRMLNEFKRSTSIFTEELKAQTDLDRHIHAADSARVPSNQEEVKKENIKNPKNEAEPPKT